MIIPRPFTVRYNPYTQTVDVIDGEQKIVNIFRALRSKKTNHQLLFCFK